MHLALWRPVWDASSVMLTPRGKARWRQLVWSAAVRRGGGDMIFTCHAVRSSQRQWLLSPYLLNIPCFNPSFRLHFHRTMQSPTVQWAAVSTRRAGRSSAGRWLRLPGRPLRASRCVSGESLRRDARRRARDERNARRVASPSGGLFTAWSKDHRCVIQHQSSDYSLRSACSPSLTLPLRAQIVYLSAQLRRLLG